MTTNNAWNSEDPAQVTKGGTGAATLADGGILLGSGTGAVTVTAQPTNGQLLIGSTGVDPVLSTLTDNERIASTNGAGTIDVDLTADAQMTAINSWNGAILETAAVTVTAAGGVITCSVQKSGGGNLTAVFSDGFYDWTTAPDTVTLTAGTDTAPTLNYVYLLQSNKTLTASTVGYPAAEHAPQATVLCQSAASLQTDGAYKVHVWTDHVVGNDDMGHISDLNQWIRGQNATWLSGVNQTLTITPNGGAADNVIFTTVAGIILQLHDHTFPAFAGTPDIYTVNDFTTPYNIVTDLNALLTDSANVSMSGKFFSLVIWGVVSEATGDCKLMVNLPSGSYNNSTSLTADSSKYANFTIPAEFKGTGFLISQLNLRHQVAAGGTWTSISEVDLRGLVPGISAGAGSAAATQFPDNTFRVFDDGDNTKLMAFEVSGLTAATTRTLTIQDLDGTIAYTAVAGGGTGAATFTDHGVLVGSGTAAITPLAVGTTGQLLVGISGADPAFGATADADFTFTSSTAGATRTLKVTNTNNANVASHAEILAESGGASGGDAFLRVSVASAQDYSFGVENSGDDDLVITDNASPSTGNELWNMSLGGQRTMPLQTRFLARASSFQNNVTGDGTTYTVLFPTETFDIGGNFASPTFTAPVTGTYLFNVCVDLFGASSGFTNIRCQLITTGATYRISDFDGAAANAANGIALTGSALATLTASDTVSVTVLVTGGAKTVDVIGDSVTSTRFSAVLVC